MARSKKLITSGGDTVRDAQAKQLVSLMEGGMPQKDAESIVGITVNDLRGTGVLPKLVRGHLERLEEAELMDETRRKLLGQAVLVECAVQDEDLKVKLGAAKELAGTAGPKVQNNTQINVGQLTPEVAKALVSLGLMMTETKETNE